MEVNLFFATNRKHKGNRWTPGGYGSDFSSDGAENLRFGKLAFQADAAKVKSHLKNNEGNGKKLARYLEDRSKKAEIMAFRERLDPNVSDHKQPKKILGSVNMFQEVQEKMRAGCDIVIYIHGYNVSWNRAIGYATSLEMMLNHKKSRAGENKGVMVILFTWPSDGMALPFVSYKSDKTDAVGSGYAVGRAMLKLRDFLFSLASGEECKQEMHLICHSMGNFVLQNAVARLAEFSTGKNLPRIFDKVFLCSPDVDDDVLEPNRALDRLHEMCRSITVYYNSDDIALHISDYTKGNPERLGSTGVSRVSLLHNKVHQVNCTEKVKGVVEHSYYLWGPIAADIRMNIDNVSLEDDERLRVRDKNHTNSWRME